MYIALPGFGGDPHEAGLADTGGSSAAPKDTAKSRKGACILD